MTSEVITLDTAMRVVNDVLGPRGRGDPIDGEARFVELGLDSLDVAELFLQLEEAAGRQLDPASAGELEKVGDLTRLQPAA